MKDTIDLKSIVRILMDKILWILASVFVLGAIVYVYSAFAMTPTYTATAKLYVQGTVSSEEAVSSAEVAIRQRIIPLYQQALSGYDNLDRLSEQLKTEGTLISTQTLRGCVQIATDDVALDVLHVTVSTSDPTLSYRICNQLTEMAPQLVGSMVSGYTLEVLDSARRPSSPSSPNIMMNVILGVLVGLVLSCGVIIVLHMIDNTIKDSDRVTEVTQLRFMGEIPDMNESFKGGYSYYKYGGKSGSGQGGRT